MYTTARHNPYDNFNNPTDFTFSSLAFNVAGFVVESFSGFANS